MIHEPANTTNSHQEVTTLPTVSTRTQEVQEVTNTQVTNYSQSVLDYQGRANGFLTYAKGTARIMTALLPFVLPFLFQLQEPAIVTPEPEIQIEQNTTS